MVMSSAETLCVTNTHVRHVLERSGIIMINYTLVIKGRKELTVTKQQNWKLKVHKTEENKTKLRTKIKLNIFKKL